MPEGYCTLDDLRRALREENLSADLTQDTRMVVDAITAETEPLEKRLKRHWYAPTGATILDEADEIDIPTGPKTRDDEHDIPTAAAFVVDDGGPAPKTSQGDYAKIELDRRDVESIDALHVRTADGSYEDWVASNDYTEGSWPPSGEDYYLRVNNGGWSRVYLDTTNFLKEDEDDEYVLDSWANAVYVELSYGHEGIPSNVRRAVALRAGAELAEDAVVQIPDNAKIYNIETKADQMREKADELLEVYK